MGPYTKLAGITGLLLFACVTAAPAASAAKVLRYVGATTLQQDFMPEAARLFEQQTGVMFTIDGGNSTPGINAVLAGLADIAGSGRFLTREEKAAGLVETLIGWDPMALVVHVSNPIESLTLPQVRRLVAGDIVNWREVGGRDLPVLHIATARGSGMRDTLEQLVLRGRDISPRSIICLVVAETDQQVARLPAAFTIISTSMVDDSNVKMVRVSGTLPTPEIVASGRYPLVKPLLLVTKGPPRGAVADFIEFARETEGQAIMARKFIPFEFYPWRCVR